MCQPWRTRHAPRGRAAPEGSLTSALVRATMAGKQPGWVPVAAERGQAAGCWAVLRLAAAVPQQGQAAVTRAADAGLTRVSSS